MLKTISLLALFAVAVFAGWAIHPALGVGIAIVGYWVIDGVLTR